MLAAVLAVESGGSTDVVEGGATDTYDLNLDMVPTGNVEVTVTSDAETEVSANGIDFFASVALTFTDMTPQTVTVRAIDDIAIEGAHTGILTHDITATADAVNYPLATVVPNVTANIADDDATTVALDAGNDLIVSDPSNHDDTITLSVSAANVRVSDPAKPLLAGSGTTQVDANTVDVPIAAITGATGVIVDGNGGDDTLTIDFGGGNFSVAITFNGGGHSAGDRLAITGGAAFADVAHAFINDSDGSIDVTGNQTIDYTGLEPIADDLNAMNRVFTFSGAAETISLGDDGDVNDNESTIDSSVGESVTFTSPTVSLTVNGAGGADTFNLNTLDAMFAATLAVNGDADADVFNVLSVTGATSNVLAGGTEDDTFVLAATLSGSVMGDAGNDVLAAQGDGTNTFLHLPDAATTGSGVLNFDAQPINFSAIERTELANAGSGVVRTPNANDVLTLTNGIDVALGGASPTIDVTGTSGGVSIATIAFLQNTLATIDTAAVVDGTDQISVVSADNNHMNQSLTFLLGANGDTLALNGGINVTAAVTVTSTDADVNDNNDAAADITAADLVVTAATFGDAGGNNAIDTAVQNLTVSTVGGNGDQFINEVDAITSLNLNAGTGDVTLNAGGAVEDADAMTDIAAANLVSVVAGGIGGAAGLDTELMALDIVSSAAVSCIDVHVDNNAASAGPLTINGATSAGGCDVIISNVGNTAAAEGILINGLVTAAGANADVVIDSNSPLIVNNNQTVSAEESVALTAADTALAGDDITVRANASIQTTNGDITISAGDDVTLESGSSLIADTANDGVSNGQLMILGDEGNDSGAVIAILGTGLIGAAGGTMIRGNAMSDVVTIEAQRLRATDDFSLNLRAGADAASVLFAANAVLGAGSLVVNADDGADDGQVDTLTFDSTSDTAARVFAVEYDNGDGSGQFSQLQAGQVGTAGTTIDVNRADRYRFLASAGIPAAQTNVLSLAGEAGQANQMNVGNLATGQLFEISQVNCVHILGQGLGDLVNLSQVLVTTDSVIVAGDGPDDVTGTPGRDVIFGGTGADVLRGGPGDDFLFADHTLDQNGNSVISSIDDGDMLFGGVGTDSAVSFGADTIAEIEGDLFVSGAIVDVIAWLRARFIFDGNGAVIINDALALACASFLVGNGIHQAVATSAGGSPEGETPLQNPDNNLDVNADGSVAAGDALAVINLLNSFGSARLEGAEGEGAGGTLFYDVNGDNNFSPVDVLHVINHLNDPVAQAEGEGGSSLSPTIGWLPADHQIASEDIEDARTVLHVNAPPRDAAFGQATDVALTDDRKGAVNDHNAVSLDEDLLGVLAAELRTVDGWLIRRPWSFDA